MSPYAARVGAKVLVPWGMTRQLPGEIVEVWGDPPRYIRVRIDLGDADEPAPIVILLYPSMVEAA